MAFPFWWIGALTAGLFLAAVFTLFGMAMRLLARTTDGMRDSMLPGLVSGFRDWAGTQAPRRRGSPAAESPASGPVIEMDDTGQATPVEPLRRR